MANITTRKNKAGEIVSYRIRVSRGYDSSGKKLKPYEMTWKPSPGMTARQTEKELNRIVVQFEQECRNGISSVHGSMKLADFCPQYLEMQQNVLAPRTWEQYKTTIEKKIIPAMGHLKLKDIRPAHVQAFVEELQGDVKLNKDGTPGNPPSPATIKRKLAILQSILRQAVKLDLITANPADAKKLTLPKTPAPKTEIFSRQDAALMLKALESEPLQYQTFIQLAIVTGCRSGELCGLKFSDFDFTAQSVTIERSAYKLKDKPIALKPPKDYAARTITVNRYCIQLVQLLREEKQRTAEQLGTAWKEGHWLFTQWDGTIMHPQTMTKWFPKFLKRHGLKHRKLHSLRHTSATLLLYGGVDIKAVQSRLGHGSLDVTNQYLHLVQDADVAAANILDNMLTITKTEGLQQPKEA